MADLIERDKAIEDVLDLHVDHRISWKDAVVDTLAAMPSAQPERILYANISDTEFEKWLYEHGICHPNIHESIPCDVIPLLIDNAISELPSTQLETAKRVVGKSRNGMTLWYQCDVCNEPIDKEDAFCRGCGRRLVDE